MLSSGVLIVDRPSLVQGGAGGDVEQVARGDLAQHVAVEVADLHAHAPARALLRRDEAQLASGRMQLARHAAGGVHRLQHLGRRARGDIARRDRERVLGALGIGRAGYARRALGRRAEVGRFDSCSVEAHAELLVTSIGSVLLPTGIDDFSRLYRPVTMELERWAQRPPRGPTPPAARAARAVASHVGPPRPARELLARTRSHLRSSPAQLPLAPARSARARRAGRPDRRRATPPRRRRGSHAAGTSPPAARAARAAAAACRRAGPRAHRRRRPPARAGGPPRWSRALGRRPSKASL